MGKGRYYFLHFEVAEMEISFITQFEPRCLSIQTVYSSKFVISKLISFIQQTQVECREVYHSSSARVLKAGPLCYWASYPSIQHKVEHTTVIQ